MKKIFAIAALVCCSIVSFGQNKGDVSFTGNLSFSFEKSKNSYGDVERTDKYSSFGIGAGANYFVIDNLCVGLGINYLNSGYTSSKNNSFNITPTIAYYIGICDNFYYKPGISYSFQSEKSKYDFNDEISENTTKSNCFMLNIGSFEYRVHDHFAIAANVLSFMMNNRTDGDYKYSILNFTFPSIGIVYYL